MIYDYGNTFNMFDEMFEGFYCKNRKFIHVEGNEGISKKITATLD